jgi:beta-carotene ketolase (CrtW type)
LNPVRQTAIGLALGGLIAAAWLGLHLWGVFLHPWTPAGWVTAPLLIAVGSWLGAGLFIVAHDAMHGSLAPGRPRLNRWAGQAALTLYAGFPLKVLSEKHRAHHRNPGSPDDPDFHAAAPRAFWPWYGRFFATYFGWRQVAFILAVFAIYLLLGASPLNAALFWGAPALLSSLQLFTFGTWLPHRHEDAPFADAHNARTLAYGWLGSLFACFHFGYHREHHLSPATPWWRLPSERRRLGVDAPNPAV